MTDTGTDEPLGIADLMRGMTPSGRTLAESPDGNDHWYWCRRHERAEHVSVPPAWPNANGLVVDCVRVGPFMSEREANRLRGLDRSTVKQPIDWIPPLGMDVELSRPCRGAPQGGQR